MNLYVVVEGRHSERKVYPAWIGYTNPRLTQVADIGELKSDNYYLISGMGYPQYFEVIDAAIEDVRANDGIDYLVISVDSEEMSYNEKLQEIETFVDGRLPPSRLKIVIQHFCFETWALGNRVVYKRHPEDATLRAYMRRFNTLTSDPELLPDTPEFGMNRAQFAVEYLRRVLREKYPRGTYNKRDPVVLMQPTYFTRIGQRYAETPHIRSFGGFLDAFADGEAPGA